MQLEKSYGTVVDNNPVSEIIGGNIIQAVTNNVINRDLGIEENIDDNDIDRRNFYMKEVCAETNNQR